MSIREEIFKQEKNFDLGETSDEVLYEHTESIIKLFEKLIDAYIVELKDGKEWGSSIPVITLEALKEQLKR